MNQQLLGTNASAVAGRGEAGPAVAEASAGRPGSARPASSGEAPPATGRAQPGATSLLPSEPQNSGMTAEGVTPLATRILPQLSTAPRMADILRSLGHPPGATPPREIVESVERLMGEARAYIQPRGTYSIYAPTNLTEHSLEIGGSTIIGDIGELLQSASRVAVFMVTVGNEITRQAKARGDSGDSFGGRVLDTIGSWATELTMDALMTEMKSELGAGESFTARYSPGFCGMDLDQQRVLFRLAPARDIGISLLPSLFMQPLKSISGIAGLGPRELVGTHLSPCERCPLTGCHMRR